MGFISDLLGFFKDENEHKEVDNVKKTNLSYNTKLISMLESDHKQLFKIYSELIKLFKKDNNYRNVNRKLIDFKMALQIHLMVEDTQLYGYLEQRYSDNKMVLEFIKDVQKEMTLIAETAVLFVRKYTDVRMYNDNKDNFIKDLENIGKVLTKRVNMEESRLYSLYQQ